MSARHGRTLVGGLLAVGALGLAHGQEWSAPNPYRTAPETQRTTMLTQGQAAYAQHCARCHGAEARQPSAEAPDLRRLNSFCLKLQDVRLAQRCQQDVDTYYSQSVQEGKVRAGVTHMPAWRDTLAPATAWAIQLFVEAQPKPQPRTTPRVDAARGP